MKISRVFGQVSIRSFTCFLNAICMTSIAMLSWLTGSPFRALFRSTRRRVCLVAEEYSKVLCVAIVPTRAETRAAEFLSLNFSNTTLRKHLHRARSMHSYLYPKV